MKQFEVRRCLNTVDIGDCIPSMYVSFLIYTLFFYICTQLISGNIIEHAFFVAMLLLYDVK